MIDEKKLIEALKKKDDRMDFVVPLKALTIPEVGKTVQAIVDKLLEGFINLINAQPKVSGGWIPVSERLPEELPNDGGAWSEDVRPSVDVLIKVKGLKRLYTAWYSYSHKDWVDVREEHCFTNVTHWMPLPEPPKDGEV